MSRQGRPEKDAANPAGDREETRTQLERAELHIAAGRFREARSILEEIANEDPVHAHKRAVDRAESLLARIDRLRGLRTSRRILVGTALAVALVVALLLAIRVPSTIVELEAAVSRVSFTVAERTELGPLAAVRIDIAPGDAVRIGPARLAAGAGGRGRDYAEARLQSKVPYWAASVGSEYLRLSKLVVGAGTRITLEVRDRPHRLKVIVNGGRAQGALDTAAKVSIDCGTCALAGSSGEASAAGGGFSLQVRDQQLAFLVEAGQLSLDLQLPAESAGLELQPHVRISSLDFSLLRGESVETSLVGAGQLKLAAVGGKLVPLSAGETLLIERLQRFDLNRLTLGKHLTVKAFGEAGVVKSGYPGYLRNWLPSCLEWLHANQAASLSLAAIASALSIILAILYRLKILEEK